MAAVPLQFHLPVTVLVAAAAVVALYHYLTACACVFALLAGTASTLLLATAHYRTWCTCVAVLPPGGLALV